MLKTFEGVELHNRWANGKSLSYNGINYRVGKMSYGQFFLEPGPEGRETEPFNQGTLWLTKKEKEPTKYIIE